MQKLFNAAALDGGYYNTAAVDGGYYNTAAVEGGAYNTAALVGGSELYDDAAVIGGFALASLASRDAAPGPEQLIKFGYITLQSLPPTVRDTIAKMFNPKTNTDKQTIYLSLAMLYLLDSLKAMSIAPEIAVQERNLARQRWIIMQNYLQKTLDSDVRHTYNRLLRYIHIPHHSPKATKKMRDRWLGEINRRSREWGRSKAFHALPHGLSTKKYFADTLQWGTLSDTIPKVRSKTTTKAGKKRKAATTAAKPAAKKRRAGVSDNIWADPSTFTD